MGSPQGGIGGSSSWISWSVFVIVKTLALYAKVLTSASSIHVQKKFILALAVVFIALYLQKFLSALSLPSRASLINSHSLTSLDDIALLLIFSLSLPFQQLCMNVLLLLVSVLFFLPISTGLCLSTVFAGILLTINMDGYFAKTSTFQCV